MQDPIDSRRSRHSPLARIAAPLALILAAVALLMVISSSSGTGSDDASGRAGGGKSAKTSGDNKQTEESSPKKKYVVQPGDSLSTIADRFGVSVEQILSLNPDIDPQALSTGQKIKLR